MWLVIYLLNMEFQNVTLLHLLAFDATQSFSHAGFC